LARLADVIAEVRDHNPDTKAARCSWRSITTRTATGWRRTMPRSRRSMPRSQRASETWPRRRC